MNREKAKKYLQQEISGSRKEWYEAIDVALKDMEKIDRIEQIINSTKEWIQEDVIRYKMICEVLESDR